MALGGISSVISFSSVRPLAHESRRVFGEADEKAEGEAVTAYFLIDDDGDVLEVYSKREDQKQALVGEYFLHIEERWISAEDYHCLLASETEEHRLSLEQGHRRRQQAFEPR